MGYRYTVYCGASAAHVEPAHLADAVRSFDVPTIADDAGVSPDAALAALESLAVETTASGSFHLYRLTYRPDLRHPLEIQQWENDPAAFDAAAAGLAAHPARRQLAAAAGGATDVVEVAFDNVPGEGIANVLAGVVAVTLVTWFGGVFRDPHNEWWEADGGTVRQVVPPDAPTAQARPADAGPARPSLHASLRDPAMFVPDGGRAAARPRAVKPLNLPADCPDCHQPLYPGGDQFRPRASLSLVGRAVRILALVLGCATFLGVGAWGWAATGGAESGHNKGRGITIGLMALVAALVPGLGLGYLSEQLPEVIAYRCRKCGWRRRYKLG